MTEDARRFWGWLRIAVGVLITSLCGGCTIYMTAGPVAVLLRTPGDEAAWSILDLSLLIGGVPTLAGLIFIGSGIRLLRAKR